MCGFFFLMSVQIAMCLFSKLGITHRLFGEQVCLEKEAIEEMALRCACVCVLPLDLQREEEVHGN